MKTKVLVIDDDLGWQDYYDQVLSSFCELEFCRDGVNAMALIDKAPPDLIILDFLLTGPTGMALLHEMQSYIDLAKIPVVIVSNVAGEIVGELDEYGVVAVLAKDTMSPEDLIRGIKKWT